MASPEQTDTFEQQNAAGVGALLKASRLRIGEELRDIAGILKIRYVFLEAIENGRFEELPGTTYTLGFVRAYAEHLGLDSDEVIRRFKNQESGAGPRSQLDFPEPITEALVPGGAVVFIGVVVAVLAYGAWYVNSSGDGFFKDLVEPLPERFAKMLGEPKAVEKAESEKTDPEKTELEPQADAKPAETTEEPTLAESQPDTAQQSKPEQPPESVAETVAEPAAEPKPEKIAEATPQPTPEATPQPTPEAPPESAEAPAPEKILEVASTETSRPAPEPSAAPEPAPADEPVLAPSVVPMDLIPSASGPEIGAAPASQISPARAPVSTTDEAAEAQIEATPETSALPAAEEVSRIIVRAKSNSWIQVRDDIANELLLTRLLRAGDSYTVPGRKGLMLSTGNAGALEILVDGVVVAPIGDEGTVRRKVMLDAAKLKAGTAVSE